MKIVLIGYMGSGKTSVGKQLSTALNYKFIDLDAQIELSEGMSVSKIFSERGEIYFRRKENEIIKNLILSEENMVLATGGGTPCYGDITNFLASKGNVITIYLKTTLDILTNRLMLEKNKRPLISHLNNEVSLKDFVRKHLFERSYYYNQAQLGLDTDRISVEEIVETIVAKLF